MVARAGVSTLINITLRNRCSIHLNIIVRVYSATLAKWHGRFSGDANDTVTLSALCFNFIDWRFHDRVELIRPVWFYFGKDRHDSITSFVASDRF